MSEMARDETMVIGIDPGLTCGWSVGCGAEVVDSGEAPAHDFLSFLWSMIAAGVVDRIAMEHVDPRGWSEEIKRTVEVSGVIKWMASMAELPLNEVPASNRLKFINDVNLKGHARDAEAVRLWDQRYGRW